MLSAACGCLSDMAGFVESGHRRHAQAGVR